MGATNSELRAAARNSLSGNWGKGVIVCLLYSIIVGALSYVPYLGWIAGFLVTGPLMLGVYVFFLRLVREESPSVAAMFDGFQDFGRAFVLYVLNGIFVFLWTLLLVIPGIIAAYRYSQAYYLLHDNPEIGAMEALRRSGEMMRGHKGRLFLLHLSFIGWALLCIPTFGIGFLWLYPYITATQAAFHEDLKRRITEVVQI